MSNHSPLPWFASGNRIVAQSTSVIIAETSSPRPYDPGGRQQTANAELIVRAVNSHAELLAACEAGLKALEAAVYSGVHGMTPAQKKEVVLEHATCKRLRAAIALAEGKNP